MLNSILTIIAITAATYSVRQAIHAHHWSKQADAALERIERLRNP